jgi:hypothetical protein
MKTEIKDDLKLFFLNRMRPQKKLKMKMTSKKNKKIKDDIFAQLKTSTLFGCDIIVD